VNGVINIITKKASETKGALVTAGGGNVDQGFGTLQYGGAAGKSTDYRVYAKYLDQDHLPDPSGEDGGDGWHMLTGGFRTDSTISPRDTLTFRGNMYSAREGTPTTYDPSIAAPASLPIELFVNIAGGFLQGVWADTYSPTSGTTLQVSYEHYARNDSVGDHRGTLNLDFAHHFAWGDRNNVVWGLNFRDSDSHSHPLFLSSFVPADLNTQLYGAFIQDEIAIRPDRLYLTVGAKLEHNYYTGLNVMPSARVAWTPTTTQTLWAAVSDADRSPSALDAGFRSDISSSPGPGGVPVVLALIGNPQVQDEALIAYEAGYRTTIANRLSVDFASYYNDYDHAETTEPGMPFFENSPAPPHLVVPLTFENLMHGETHGIEIAATWKVTNRWTLNPGYAFEEIHMHLAPTSQDTTSVAAAEGSSPDHSAQLRSRVELSHGLTWDTSVYFVGRLTDPSEPSYTRLDTQLSWKFNESTSISFVGQNLVKNLHQEFVDATASAQTTLIKRSAYIKFTWRY
jgi:iron complex outermembrane receptor protein